jgi:hypothetical protein
MWNSTLSGKKANVNIRFENVAKVLGQHLSPRLVDFLEIASYVFSADCATPRGKAWTDESSTEPWSRDLSFVIPVRDLAFWASPKVKSLLEEVLTFLSNDKFSFNFEKLKHDRPARQEYLESESRIGLSMLPSVSSCSRAASTLWRVQWTLQ